jgi:uncharacterized BrkB/YihY/UPF0761 family membrane protein
MLLRLGQGLVYHDAFRAAPAMAFHFFLSLLPLLAFIGYVLGVVARRKGVSAVLGVVFENLPATAEAVLKKEVTHLASADRLGPIAAIGFLWVASGGTHGLMDVVVMVVGAPRRAWWKQRLIALGWVIATLGMFGVASFGIIQWDDVVHAPEGTPAVAVSALTSAASPRPTPTVDASESPRPIARRNHGDSAAPLERDRPNAPRRARKFLRGGAERALALVFTLAASVIALAAFYRFAVAHSRTIRRRVFPGAALAVGLWIIVSWCFSLYLRTLASYTMYYGSLAAVAVLLVWLWLVSLAILVGAELNSQLEGIRD